MFPKQLPGLKRKITTLPNFADLENKLNDLQDAILALIKNKENKGLIYDKAPSFFETILLVRDYLDLIRDLEKYTENIEFTVNRKKFLLSYYPLFTEKFFLNKFIYYKVIYFINQKLRYRKKVFHCCHLEC